MNRTIEKTEYRFDETGHKHEFLKDGEWKPLMGVTTVLSVISKPALIQWAANVACDYISDNFPTVEQLMEKPTYITELIEDARIAHRKKKEAAGDIGSEAHGYIETIIKKSIEETDGRPTTSVCNEVIEGIQSEQVKKMVSNFCVWALENQVKFLESEKHVYSKNLWIGGILDMVIELNGEKLIADVKTSSGIYNEAFFQMAAYDLCMEEMGESVDGYLVINIKKTGEFDLKIAPNKEINRRAFLAALELYKIINSIQ